MSNSNYPLEATALLLFDPYNDFLSEGGKLYSRFSHVADEVHLMDHLRLSVNEARKAGVQVVFVPHRRWRTGDFDGWSFPNATQLERMTTHTFEDGTWGGSFHDDLQPLPGELVAQEHWAQNGFVNTDLAVQLRQRGITHIVAVGMVANTCIEGTCRFGMELGFHVSIVTDAAGAATPEALHAAHVISAPTFAHRILTTQELVDHLRS